MPLNAAQIGRTTQVALNTRGLEKRVGQMEETINNTLERQLDKMITTEGINRAQTRTTIRTLASEAVDEVLDRKLADGLD